MRIFSDWFSENPLVYNNDPDGLSKAENDMVRFVTNYRTICELRNNTNHSDQRIGFDELMSKAKGLCADLIRIKELSANLPASDRSFFINDDIPKNRNNTHSS